MADDDYSHLSESTRRQIKARRPISGSEFWAAWNDGEGGRTAIDFNPTDLGMAEMLAYFHGKELRYVEDWKKWLYFDGRRWANSKADVQHILKRLIRSVMLEGIDEDDRDTRHRLLKQGMKYEQKGKLADLLSLAQNEMPATPDEFDSDPYLFNVENGTVVLKGSNAGQLATASPLNLITKVAAVRYDQDATCPRWNQFLLEVMQGDEELVEFLQTFVGYSLTGDTSEHCFVILWGTGANGKSTFLDTLQTIFGDYAKTASTDTFLSKRYSGIPNDIAALRGARFVSAAETDADRRLAEALVKRIVSGDPMTARFLHGEFFEFVPQLKLYLATNHKPVVKNNDNAIWRRVRLVEFTRTFAPDEQDTQLKQKLLAERAGILNWAIEGCLRWQELGRLPYPEALQKSTQAYRAEMDTLGAFIEEHYNLTRNSADTVQSSVLFKAWCDYCDDAKESPGTQKSFSLLLQSTQGLEKKTVKGRVYWTGIKPTEQVEGRG